MPSYDYKCKDCNENFTVEKSMTDPATPDCPRCKSSNISRVWGGFQLKGCEKSSGSSSGSNCGSCSGGSCGSCC